MGAPTPPAFPPGARAVVFGEIKKIGPVQGFVGRFAESCGHPGFDDLFLFAYHGGFTWSQKAGLSQVRDQNPKGSQWETPHRLPPRLP